MATNIITEAATNTVAVVSNKVAAVSNGLAVPANMNPFVLEDKIKGYILDHAGALIGCIIVVFAGFFISRWVAGLIARALERKAIEPPVRMLIVRIARLFLIGMCFCVALETLGVNLTALIAGISVAGVGVGLAMQGLLGNMVAGLAIIFIKPFRVGEYIELLGVEGQVSKIELVSTTLLHTDHSRVVIPNRKIIGEVLHNYGASRQVDLSVGVSYSTDLKKAQQVIAEVLRCSPRVLRDPAPLISVTAMGDSAITITIKPWVKLDDMVDATNELNLALVEAFRANQIDMPFPQREIRILNTSSPTALSA